MSTETLNSLVTKGVLELSDGYRTKQSELGQPGVPILRVAEVLDGTIAPRYKDHVSEELRRSFQRKTTRPDDVVLTTKGTVGRVARVGRELPEFVYSPQLCFFRVADRRLLDSGWLYNWFRGGEFRTQALRVQDQTDMAAYINLVDLRRMHITVPSLDEQRAVAAVLGALDAKIECNDRLARLADERWTDELTQALNGWDVGGPLPSGWSRASLSSLARFVNGRNFTKDATGTGRMVVRIAELNSGPGRSTVYNEIDVPSDHVARPGDLLFAWSGSLTVQRWFRPEAIVNQHIFKVIPHSDIPTWLVHGYLLKLLPWYRQIAAGKATTMGHIQRHHLDEPVPLLDAATRNALDERCAPLWHRALAAEQESLGLAQLRDTLLPRLLSGELRVRDAEAAVEEVA